MGINTNIGTSGRFGNHFFRNMAAHFICKAIDLKFEYSFEKEFNNLGVYFYKGYNYYDFRNTMNINNSNFMAIIKSSQIQNNNKFNIYLDTDYFQTREFAEYLREYFNTNENKQQVMKANPYKKRYRKNEDVYIHIRLDDAIQYSQPFEYFDNLLDKIMFEDGYISSDNIKDPLCVKLIEKYELTVINKSEVETIQFASTCKNIILSTGTFSWMIGLFAFYSTIYYPKIKKIWHGDIFVFPDWNCIDW